MGYETKPGLTTDAAPGGQYDRVGDSNLQYPNLAAQYAADAAQSAIDAANTGRLTIGTVTTGAPGSAAAAVITGDPGAQVIDMTIPTGAQGPAGPSGGGSGTVTSVSVVSANGLAGTVADPTVAPAITLSTTVTGIVKGNGTGLAAAVDGVDYLTPVMTAIGDMVAGGAAGLQTRVPGNTTPDMMVLTQVGDGVAAGQPIWQPVTADLVPYSGATHDLDLNGKNVNSVQNLNFTGTANRITGDFSNATVANRVMFQTSTVNGNTTLGAIPNGTAATCTVAAYSDIDLTNANFAAMQSIEGAAVVLEAGKTGGAPYTPMTFYTGGSERMRIAADGAVGIGMTPSSVSSARVDAMGGAAYGAAFRARSTTSDSSSWARSDVQHLASPNAFMRFQTNTGAGYIRNDGADPSIIFAQAGVDKVALDGAGGLTLRTAAGLGYGAGAGGTVTQATSKSTAVTLNKPTGKITTAADALAASARASFPFNNSFIGANDVLVLMPAVAGGNYNVQVIDSGTGVAYIEIFNKSGVSQSQAIDIKFAIIKGSSA